jgi:hypothetical protein
MNICQECNKKFETYQSFRNHLRFSHNNISQYEYYIKWIKTEDDGKCKICGNDTKFISLRYGYKKCCSKECSNKYKNKRIKTGVKEKYKNKKIIKKKEKTNKQIL